MSKFTMSAAVRLFCVALALLAIAAPVTAATKVHHVALQIDSKDPAVMNQLLNNAANVTQHFQSIGEDVEIEVVAYGPGLNMLREDTSPVKVRLKSFKEGMPNVTFSACDVTRHAMAKAEGKDIPIVPEARIVPSGVVRLMELQEQGWSYIKP